MYLVGISPNKNTLEPLRDGINLSIKVLKGLLFWHPTVLADLNLEQKIRDTVNGTHTRFTKLTACTWYHVLVRTKID